VNPEKVKGLVYQCVRCGALNRAEDLAELPDIRCICGYRVLRKVRPPIAKVVISK
jgi:DNA-directed RNA polymerase subunit P